jgi:hypothetical protein
MHEDKLVPSMYGEHTLTLLQSTEPVTMLFPAISCCAWGAIGPSITDFRQATLAWNGLESAIVPRKVSP